VGEKKTP